MGARPLGKADPAAALACGTEATTSFLLWDENVRLLIDLGTGLGATVQVARHLRERKPDAASFLTLTHYHEDHWCGLRWCGPFAADDLPTVACVPRFAEGFSKDATAFGIAPLRRLIDLLDEPGFWPAPVLDPPTRIEDSSFAPGEVLFFQEWTIRTCLLPHPGGCVGYRVEMPGDFVVAIATDCELNDASLSESDRQRFDAFFDGVDLLVLDVQYLDEEYDGEASLGGATRDRRGWGHNCPRLVAKALSRLERPPRVLLVTHHDADRTISDLHDERIGRELLERLHELPTRADRARLDPPMIANLLDGDLWDLESPTAFKRVDYRSCDEQESDS